MKNFAPERGDIAITLDKPRILRFDMRATKALIERYGSRFPKALYRANSAQEIELTDVDVLVVFLYIGLQADALGRGEVLTLKQVERMIYAYNLSLVFSAVVASLTGAISTPLQGKAQPAGAAAKPAGDPKAAPGPTKVSTLMKRSASPSERSAGRQKPSGRRRSAK